MKITLCSSIAFYDEMLEIKSKLEKANHEVDLPPLEVKGEHDELISVKEYYKIRKGDGNSDDSWVWARKAEAIRSHFNKVEWADAILVTNYKKNDIEGYIGANTFLEMGLAFHLGKPIYLLNPIPDMWHKEEILGMKPVVIENDFKKISH